MSTFFQRAKWKRQSHLSAQEKGSLFSSELSVALTQLHTVLGQSYDITTREIYLNQLQKKAAIVYVEGIIDQALSKEFLSPFTSNHQTAKDQSAQTNEEAATAPSIEQLVSTLAVCRTVKTFERPSDCIDDILFGYTALLIDSYACAFLLDTASFPSRTMDEPVTESVIRGPRIGFVETIADNVALLRHRIRNRNLTFLSQQVGEHAPKLVVVSYIEDIANPALVDEVLRRVKSVEIDDLQESSYLEDLIEDDPWSPFPLIQSTERPDRVEAALLEGRIGILVDGSPFALIAPVTYPMLLQSPDDYYQLWYIGSLLRFLRFICILISLFLPSLYVSLVSYHQGLIPMRLAFTIAGTREGVPFPTIIEALIMEITIEILREAGLRLPKPLGQTIGIVGGLVIGQSAVEAGIVSPIMVVVVALTAIASFTIPQYEAGIVIRILRFGMMLSAAFLGLYGVILFFIILTSHLVKLKSFGVDYLAPIAPLNLHDWKDFILRLPQKSLTKRPQILHPLDSKRIKKKP
ncbi:spore germination protein [Brevibacillus laterosporus]|uniref:Spore germination protein n=1 Tax=Brevibacillus laterosporus TaxID=1465 RepID=A0A502HBX6_BRELA|nr:spore germination protein [Brevibacillus laterosporus]QDX92861.1 spore germination protein [Brevibacillus laterosporus]TPG71215.1 spore germination protein [Brevibacillus laterosporus]TPG82465.1 spore germination protein [Brevibacillus laterosporus]